MENQKNIDVKIIIKYNKVLFSLFMAGIIL